MRSIIRCPTCFTFVYSDARNCHGCGQRIGKRRLLTRGSWIFIVLAVAGFTVARGIDLQQDKSARLHRQIAQAARHEMARDFIRSWLTAPADELKKKAGSRKTFTADLLKLRERYPEALPATNVRRVELNDARFRGYVAHVQKGSDPTVHEGETSAPTARATDPRRPSVMIYRNNRRMWTTDRQNFTVDIEKDDRSYTVTGWVCIDDDDVVCLEIEEITPAGGLVERR